MAQHMGIRSMHLVRKRGDKRNELSLKHAKVGHGFSRSKDIYEDRSRRQSKFSGRKF